MKYNLSKPLLVLLGLAAALRIYFIIVTPLYWNGELGALQAFNDEPAHLNYVKYLMEHDTLPVQTQSIQDEEALKSFEFEYYQPPLSYHMVSFLAGIAGIDAGSHTLVYFARTINMIIGIMTILYLFILSNRLFPRRAAYFITVFYAFSPVHIRHTSAFSNDALLWFLVLMLFISLLVDRGVGYKKGILEGFILGAAILTKTSALVIAGFYLAMAVIEYKNYARWLTPVLIAMVFALPYFLRNYSLYGEFLGISVSHGIPVKALSSFDPFIWFKFIRSLIISSSFPYDTLNIPFALKIPAYFAWGVIIAGSVGLALVNLWEKRKDLPLAVPEFIWLLTFASMIVYNWNILMVEFRLIYFSFPVLLIYSAKEVLKRDYRIISALFLLAIVYPLLLTIVFS